MAVKIPFRRETTADYGAVLQVSPLIRRVVARNPSAFTEMGTSTYIVGRGRVAVIDPGPALPDHNAALLTAVKGETVEAIVVTHTHRDHSPGAAALKAATGAPSYGYGRHAAGLGPDVEAGGDRDFAPDRLLRHGETVAGPGWTLEAVHTPGHTSNHLCYGLREERTLFTGDHVMGWSTSVITPPDGDMGDYMRSLDLLLTRDDLSYLPGHGQRIEAPSQFVRAFIAHRREREAQILARLEAGDSDIAVMVKSMYADVSPGLHAAAGRSVLAHLIELVQSGKVVSDRPPALDASYRRA